MPCEHPFGPRPAGNRAVGNGLCAVPRITAQTAVIGRGDNIIHGIGPSGTCRQTHHRVTKEVLWLACQGEKGVHLRPRIVDQNGSEVCQFSSVTRGTFLGRRPLVPPAQGIALGHHTPTPSVSRPNGPTDSVGRQLARPAATDYDHRLHDPVLGLKGESLARWAARVCIATWFPRALPALGEPRPVAHGDGLHDGTEPECDHHEHALEFCAGQSHPRSILPEIRVRRMLTP